jgi:D-lactate dehydrogenase
VTGHTAAKRLVDSGISTTIVRDRLIDRIANANDASHYLLTPQAVAVAKDADTVAQLMAVCGREGLAMTFRSGGTSLSGQAVTGGILVDTRRHFRGIEVLDDGRAVRVQPGATVRAVNAVLRPYGTKLGPDPASEGACTIGGVVANNSSGMSCGTQANSYQTLSALCFVLPSGTVVDTAGPDADARLAAAQPELYRGLHELRDRIRGDPVMVATITAQFSMKNTMGYGLNAFIDFDRTVDILAHLVVGSEGTLAFVASATFKTVPALPNASTGLLIFPHLTAAADALPTVVDSGAAIIELLDARSLTVAANDPRATAGLRGLKIEDQAALLVEYQATTANSLEDLVTGARSAFDWAGCGGDPLTSDPSQRADLWHVRKGLYAAVAGSRKAGTTALLEDIAVPVPQLSDTCTRLTRLFEAHGYEDCVIFGHAKDGNIHFMLTERFDSSSGLARYAAFTEDMVDLVLDQGGTLKAEHGTGRVMASFVRRQYGDDLYSVMRSVKRLCDPRGILNPGVLLSEDPSTHLHALKTTTPIEEEVDRCVECGFCEPVCPSRDLTLTPRQRIVVRRAISAAHASGDLPIAQHLEAEYDYDAVETCAADGMCQTACPVGIDTGSLVRRLRADSAGSVPQAVGRSAARHWASTTRTAAAGLTAAHAVPAVAAGLSRLARQVLGEEHVPQWTRDFPRGGTRPAGGPDHGPDAQVILFASCTHSMFGTDSGQTATDALRSLCEKADLTVAMPTGMSSLCCGMPWSSKGLTDGAKIMANRARDSLWDATDAGRLPIVADASSCSEGLITTLAGSGLHIEDAITFAARQLLPRLHITRTREKIAVHPTCSAARTGAVDDLLTLAKALSSTTFVPQSWGCCGFAGDRGLLHPELTAAATATQAHEIRAFGASLHASCNRTCEIGMTRAVGRPYRHILELIDAAATGTAAKGKEKE